MLKIWKGEDPTWHRSGLKRLIFFSFIAIVGIYCLGKKAYEKWFASDEKEQEDEDVVHDGEEYREDELKIESGRE